MWNIKCDTAPRSLDLFQSVILIGMKNGTISTLDMTDKAPGKPKPIMFSHCDGEAWAMDVVTFDGQMRLFTTSDDNRILAFDPLKREVLCEGKVSEAAKKKKGKKGGFKGGASTQSS